VSAPAPPGGAAAATGAAHHARAIRRSREHLAALARAPRPAGSPAEAEARSHAARVLGAAGFTVREEPFDYSAAVGMWGTPVGGLASMGVLVAAAGFGVERRPAAALLALGSALALAVPIGVWAARGGVLDFPALRRRAVNLVATRGGPNPEVWLVAHLDSKSQPVPIGVRAAGVTGTIVAWVAALALAGAELGSGAAVPAHWWRWVGALGVLAGLPVAASVVTARSPGALDNASGTAAVLLAVDAEGLGALPPDVSLGVLLTSAEELGLAGARAWVAARAARGEPPGLALNCDGVDDGGRTTVMLGARADARVVDALRRAAADQGATVQVRRLVPGILVDAVALAAGGWATLTVSRGTWRTLARIHTGADRLDRLDGRGVAAVATLLRGAAIRLARMG
jgi:hypothetical protein